MKELENEEWISREVRFLEEESRCSDFDKKKAWEQLSGRMNKRKSGPLNLGYSRVAAGILLLLLPAAAYFIMGKESGSRERTDMPADHREPVMAAALPVIKEMKDNSLSQIAEEKTKKIIVIKRNGRKRKINKKTEIAADSVVSRKKMVKNSEMGLMATTMINTPCLTSSPPKYMFN